MLRFIAWRLVQFPFVLAVIYLLTFFLAWIAPGSPFEGNDKKLPQAVLDSIKHRMHADHWYTFLGYYPRQMIHGDFGYSLAYQEWTVTGILKDALPVSIALGLFAMIIATFAGVAIGTLAAVRRGGVIDWASLGLSLLGISVPSFVMAAVMLIVFGAALNGSPWAGGARRKT